MSELEIANRTLGRMLDEGFDKSACRVNREELHELQSENGEINLFRTNFETEVSLSGIKEQRRAALVINRTDQESVDDAVKSVVEMADGANADPAFDYAEHQPAESFASGPASPDYDVMYDRIDEVQRYAAQTYPSLNLRSVGITFYRRQGTYVNSSDVHFDSSRGVYQVSVSFSSKVGTDTSSMMYTGYARYALNDPVHESVQIDELFKQSTEQVSTNNIPGKFVGDMIISPGCLMSFLGFLTMRLGDGPMISGTSVYKGKLGECVAAPALTLRSSPLDDEIATGYWVTGDGYRAENLTVVNEGILTNYLLGIYGANKTGLPRAVNSGGCYVVDAGDDSYAELIDGVTEGILINRFSGGRPNDRGDFSGIAKNSYYIKDGQVQYPIRETTVSGNLVALPNEITGISIERLNSGGSILPWIRVRGITIS